MWSGSFSFEIIFLTPFASGIKIDAPSGFQDAERLIQRQIKQLIPKQRPGKFDVMQLGGYHWLALQGEIVSNHRERCTDHMQKSALFFLPLR